MLPIAIEHYRLMTLLTSNNKRVLSFPIEKLFYRFRGGPDQHGDVPVSFSMLKQLYCFVFLIICHRLSLHFPGITFMRFAAVLRKHGKITPLFLQKVKGFEWNYQRVQKSGCKRKRKFRRAVPSKRKPSNYTWQYHTQKRTSCRSSELYTMY